MDYRQDRRPEIVMKHMVEPDLKATSTDVVTELLREYHGAEFTEPEMENDPVGCISRILEDLRAGNGYTRTDGHSLVLEALCRI